VIADFLFKNPRLLLLAILVIVTAGLVSIFFLPRLEDPVLCRRVAVITTPLPGADARQVETLVTIPLEARLAEVTEIKKVRSNSRAGLSNIVIELKDGVVDVQPVWSRVRDQIQRTNNDLPGSATSPELEVFPLKAYSAIVAIRWRDEAIDNLSILRRIASQLQAEILEVPGTEKADLFGDPGEEIVVELRPERLVALGLSVGAIASQTKNSLNEQPLGRVKNRTDQLLVDLQQPKTPVQRLERTLISAGQQSVSLADIADIRKQPRQPSDEMAIIDGQPAMVIGALVDGEVRVDRWTDRLNEVLNRFAEKHVAEIETETLFAQRDLIDQRIRGLMESLALGAAAVIIVVFFLMGWRSMFVVVTALPLSALIVIFGFRNLSIPIHQMSVTGLIVALGLLIDNAIVMVEEVRSKIVAGMPALQSVRASVRHLAMPLFGSTLTTALAFLPIALLPGPAGEFVGSIAMTVILAITASFMLSMTVIPALCGKMGIRPTGGWLSCGVSNRWANQIYQRTLLTVFRFPLSGFLLGIALPVFGFFVATQLPTQFFPPSDRRQIQVEVERPATNTLAGVKTSVDKIRQLVRSEAAIARQHWYIGRSAPTYYYNVVPRRRGTPFYAQAFLEVDGGKKLTDVVNRLQSKLDEQVLDSRVVVRQLEQGPPFDAPVEVRICGPDLAVLQRLGSELRRMLIETENVVHTRSDLEDAITKVALDVDQLALNKMGISETELAGQLFTTLEGASAGAILDGGEQLDVRIALAMDEGSRLVGLKSLPLVASRPPQIRTAAYVNRSGPPAAVAPPTLASVADFRLDSDVGGVVRINGRRVNEVKAYIRAGVLPSTVIDNFKNKMRESEFFLPPGYSIEFGGETEQRSNAIDNLVASAILLFAIMALTLVTSFRSFRCALIIAAVGGLSAGLGPLALHLFGYPFGFMAIVGTMGLIGVAINDSIVVLAAIRSRHCKTPAEMVEVVAGCTRHIIATSLTTIVGFLPLIVNGGGFWPPLAITIAGGVGGATLLALYFVPSFYLLLNRPSS
jgi:multidrug efflux pump subunit AcrB